mmetsp:Transcript_4101/g.15218  ORF Transcript_4101/g.15218 Transcript_4101/m.15218 type:complete len:330 (+) Transcript_4101:115-1104(+)
MSKSLRRPEKRVEQCCVAPQPAALQEVPLANQPAREVPSQPEVRVQSREIPPLRLHHLPPLPQVVVVLLEKSTERSAGVHHLAPPQLGHAHLQKYQARGERVEQVWEERTPHQGRQRRGQRSQRWRRRDPLRHDEVLRRGVKWIQQTLLRLVVFARPEISRGTKVHELELAPHEHQVSGLDVPMHDANVVQTRQRGQQVSQHGFGNLARSFGVVVPTLSPAVQQLLHALGEIPSDDELLERHVTLERPHQRRRRCALDDLVRAQVLGATRRHERRAAHPPVHVLLRVLELRGALHAFRLLDHELPARVRVLRVRHGPERTVPELAPYLD